MSDKGDTKEAALYRKKPVVVAAMLYDSAAVCEAIHKWIGRAHDNGECEVAFNKRYGFEIDTLEGPLRCIPGDYVIRGIKGEFYPCKPDIFEATYEPAEASAKHPVVTDARQTLSRESYDLLQKAASLARLREANKEGDNLAWLVVKLWLAVTDGCVLPRILDP